MRYIGPMTISERANELEEQLMKTLDRIPSKSALYTMGEIDPRVNMRVSIHGALELVELLRGAVEHGPHGKRGAGPIP